MGRKILAILVIVIGLAIIIGLVWFSFFYDPVESNLNQDQVVVPVDENSKALPGNSTDPLSSVSPVVNTYEVDTNLRQIGVEDLKMIAAAFAERFGSYSNHSNYSNIIDLKIFMSDKMQTWADNFVSEMRAKSNDSDIYYGVTTKAISQTASKFDNSLGAAEILVKTQYRESTGTMNNTSTTYKDIVISFVKERGAWKVDEAIWR